MSDLSAIPTEELLREVERRSFKARKVEHSWHCVCGNSVRGGELWGTAYAMAGQVWCKKCDPYTPDYYGTRGKQSAPMRHYTTDRAALTSTEAGEDQS